ncbi:MAG: hypothetical protein M3509_08335, partial [Chloroflexota bacterium]|nr:hypothetical protein [Chloroflexota bacterium]
MTPPAIAATAVLPAAAVTEVAVPVGLTEHEARERRAKGLGNQMRLESSRSYWQIIRENMFTFI